MTPDEQAALTALIVQTMRWAQLIHADGQDLTPTTQAQLTHDLDNLTRPEIENHLILALRLLAHHVDLRPESQP